LRQLGLASSMSVPLIARGRTLGALTVAISRPGRHYTREDLAFTEEVAARAALAVDNARLYREAQETSRLKDEFLATLSHELRTPLTSVLAWMWMLRRGRLDGSAVERARDTMEKSMRSLLRIIDDLLDVSRAIRGQLRLDVRPIGLGIPPEFLPHAFERFRQADASATRAQGGLGLGLDIVRHLIELHGGTVKVESPGEMGGATLIVTLPLLEPARTPASAEASVQVEPARPELAVAPSSGLDGVRVLIVDDEADTREVLSVLLAGAGGEVRTSASAAE